MRYFLLIFCIILHFGCTQTRAHKLHYSQKSKSIVRQFIDLAEENIVHLNLTITPENSYQDSLIGLKLTFSNELNDSVCIPQVLLWKSNWIDEIQMFESKSSEEIKLVKFGQNRDWPDQNYRILPPKLSTITNRDLVLSNNLNTQKSYEITASIPAFLCQSLQNGYPSTNLFSESFSRVQGINPEKILFNAKPSDIILFKASVKIGFSDDKWKILEN